MRLKPLSATERQSGTPEFHGVIRCDESLDRIAGELQLADSQARSLLGVVRVHVGVGIIDELDAQTMRDEMDIVYEERLNLIGRLSGGARAEYEQQLNPSSARQEFEAEYLKDVKELVDDHKTAIADLASEAGALAPPSKSRRYIRVNKYNQRKQWADDTVARLEDNIAWLEGIIDGTRPISNVVKDKYCAIDLNQFRQHMDSQLRPSWLERLERLTTKATEW